MANNTECLTGIIGVTRLDCACIEEELTIPAEGITPADPDWYKKSTSGFYIHELEGMVSIDAVKDVVSCEELYQFYQSKIASSIIDTADDIAASINERYKRKKVILSASLDPGLLVSHWTLTGRWLD